MLKLSKIIRRWARAAQFEVYVQQKRIILKIANVIRIRGIPVRTKFVRATIETLPHKDDIKALRAAEGRFVKIFKSPKVEISALEDPLKKWFFMPCVMITLRNIYTHVNVTFPLREYELRGLCNGIEQFFEDPD